MLTRKIKKVLVPLDGSKNSQHGLEMAIIIARNCGATVTGIYCISTSSRSEFGITDSTNEKLDHQVKKILEESETLCAQNGIAFKSKIARGDIGYHIVKTAHAKNEKFDLIIIGSRGRGAMKEMFLGSVSNYVIHASKIPVLVVK